MTRAAPRAIVTAPAGKAAKDRERMSKKVIQLTDAQIDALLWAINLTRDSYAGWEKSELTDVSRDLATLGRAELALYEAIRPSELKALLQKAGN